MKHTTLILIGGLWAFVSVTAMSQQKDVDAIKAVIAKDKSWTNKFYIH